MKHWGLFLFALALAACHDDNQPEPQPDYYITPEDDEIEADCNGVKQRIAVSSNCDWHPGAVPEWCVVQKITADGKEYLDVEVLPNTEETSRDTTIPLLYGRRIATATLTVTQSGKEKTNMLPWSPFFSLGLASAEYELLENNVTRRYRITGQQAFVTPSFRKQIFPGNLINRHTDNRTLTDYFNKYTFNPIHYSAFVNRVLYENEAQPSLDALDEMVRQITAELPIQNHKFNFSDPVQYLSYRHLHLLGAGNLGINLEEMISGKPYTKKEMERRTGMIFTYEQTLFNITMDLPDKLICELVDEEELPNLSYINNIAYGTFALLLIESNDDFVAVKRVIKQIMSGSSLSDEDLKIRDALDVWHINFDNYGAHTIRGNYTLILKSIARIYPPTTDIIPIKFETTKLRDDSVGTMEVTFDLP